MPYRKRRAAGKMHPSHDFVFIYFRFAPALLECWHPGLGISFEPPEDMHGYSEKYYTRAGQALRLDPSKLDAKARKRLQWNLDLCRSVQNKPAQFSCFGMHEWAMVHRASEHGTRHEWPLRLGERGTDEVVEGQTLAAVRAQFFRGIGCCDILDPITDLAQMGVVSATGGLS